MRAGNAALASGDTDTAATVAGAVRAMAGILGIDPLADNWFEGSAAGGDRAMDALDSLVQAQLVRRQQARKDKDFETADAIRDQLTEAGIEVADTAEGQRWSLADPAPAHRTE